MISIKGITVVLYERHITGYDELNCPVYAESPVTVDNVLVAPVTGNSMAEIQQSPTELMGQRAVYQIAIPKGDGHSWENNRVEFFGKMWRVIGPPEEGIEAMLPLPWNKKFTVEGYDGEEGQSRP